MCLRYRKNIIVQKQNKILSKAIWPGQKRTFDIDFFEMLQPQRRVCEDSRYKSGVYYSEKCNRYIQYESGLELNFILFLEQSPKVRFYWEQPCMVPYWRGKIKDTYTPDFAVYLVTGEIIMVEIKDLPGMTDHRVQTKMQGLIKFCADKGFGILLTDGKNTIDKLLKVKCNKTLEKSVLTALKDNNCILKTECREMTKTCEATQNELLKVILKNDLRHRASKSVIRPVNRNTVFRHVFINKRPYEELNANPYSTLFKSGTEK